MWMADLAVQAQPDGHPHFHAARAGDVAQIDDVFALPAEPIAKPAVDLAFGVGIVSADEEMMVAGYQSGLYHDLTIDGVESLHNERVGKLALDRFTERIGVAYGQRGRQAFREIKGIAD